jgi:hypothetical protein
MTAPPGGHGGDPTEEARHGPQVHDALLRRVLHYAGNKVNLSVVFLPRTEAQGVVPTATRGPMASSLLSHSLSAPSSGFGL